MGLLLPSVQALAASTGPVVVKDLTAATVTANGQAMPVSAAGNGTAKSASDGQSAGGNLLVLVQQLQRYQKQLNQLRGDVEQLRHQVDQMQKNARERYVDLDTRLRDLSAGKAATTSDANTATDEADSASAETPSQKPSVSAAEDNKAYVAARNKLLSGDHKGAAKALSSYLTKYPNGLHVADARYWLGEVYRIEGDDASLEKAAKQFKQLINDFPNNSKVPTALYKLATVRARQGESGKAKVALKRIRQQFPDSSEAKLAAKLLKAL